MQLNQSFIIIILFIILSDFNSAAALIDISWSLRRYCIFQLIALILNLNANIKVAGTNITTVTAHIVSDQLLNTVVHLAAEELDTSLTSRWTPKI